MRKLYEIQTDIDELISSSIDPETGEISIDEDALNLLQLEMEQKIENVILYYKDVKTELIAVDSEIMSLQDRSEKLNKTLDGLKKYLTDVLKGHKFSTPKCEAFFRKSVSVEVDDKFVEWAETFSDDNDLLTVKKTVQPNKKYIKELLKNGEDFMYARLVEKNNLNVR